MTRTQRTVAIIGAGAAGMAAAWDLVRAGDHVTVYEAGEAVGGLAAGFRDDGWDWALEKFYHHWFESDRDILRLVEEIGQRDKVLFPRPKTSYWIDGQLYRSEMNASALLLPVSPLSKLRLALAGAYLKFVPQDWRKLEQTTADSWLTRAMGDEAYGRFFRPLLIGKFADRYTEVNLAWFWARVKTRSLKLGIFEGGFQAFLEALAAAVTAQGATIHLNSPVQRITPHEGRLLLTVNGAEHVYDQVLTTTSPQLLLRMTEGLADTPYGRQAAALESIGAVCVIFALKHSLLTDGTYWLNLPATSADKNASLFPFLALVEHTNWMDKAHYGGDVLVYCGDYVPADHEYFTMDEAALIARFQAQLGRFNPDFSPDWVRRAWAFRAPYAQPLSGVNHSRNIPDLKTPLPGLYWASMSQVYPWDRGTNFAVEIGRRAAARMRES